MSEFVHAQDGGAIDLEPAILIVRTSTPPYDSTLEGTRRCQRCGQFVNEDDIRPRADWFRH
jgi:hypothetical protein